MSTIDIDKTSCTECGICAERCPACFTFENDTAAVRDDGKRCIVCGHCVALCPADAIVHEALPLTRFEPQPRLEAIDGRGFEALVLHRRSHRHFLRKTIPDEIIRRIIDCCSHSPTGVNAQEVEIKVLRTAERIRQVSGLAVHHFVDTIAALETEAQALLSAGKPVPTSLQKQLDRNGRYRNMGKSFEKGWDPIFHKAPAVMIFHAPQNAPTPRDDCTIAAHTAVLHAELLGLGTCYIGLFTRAVRERPSILSKLNIPQDNEIYSTIILGYPELTFLKVPPRTPIPTTWE